MQSDGLPTPNEVLRHSIGHPEPPLDPAYGREEIVISSDPLEPNKLMRANRRLLDLITTFGVAAQKEEHGLCDKCIEEICVLLNTPRINNSEFTSFWETNDTSFSVFRKMSIVEKYEFLRELVNRYLARRHELYNAHGYTATTLQVKSDSFAHKRSGSLAKQKVCDLLVGAGFRRRADFAQTAALDEGEFSLPDDRGNARAYEAMMQSLGADNRWSKQLNKTPDFCFRSCGRLWIVEHKHMKELGGGQDKQIAELIALIEHEESIKSISYVSFMDGILFNCIMSDSASGKVAKQRDRILKGTSTASRNYFTNTAGFVYLLSSLSRCTNGRPHNDSGGRLRP